MKQGVHRFIRIPVSQYSIVRELLDVIADPKESAAGMFTSGYNSTGTGPATHLISSGLIDAQFAVILGNAAITFAAYNQRCTLLNHTPIITLQQITDLYAASDIRTDAQGYESTVLNLLGMKPTAG
jgi:hypothetical protein